jgi:acyl-CoA hydrolase
MAYLVYVALDDQGQPVAIPPILAETPEEEQRLAAARQRQALRLKN